MYIACVAAAGQSVGGIIPEGAREQMIALPYFNYEVAPGEELRVIGGVSIGVEGEKLRALRDAIVVLVSDGIIHVIHQRTSPGEPIKLSRPS